MIFLGEFSHSGYKLFLKKLGFFFSIVWIREKNDQKMEKIRQNVQTTKLEKKKEKKPLVQRYIDMFAL